MPHSRWLIFLPVALFALFAPQSAEASQVGLLVRGYQIDQIPPTKSDIAYPLCGSSVEPFINATWDGQPYEQCDPDMFMLHYTGYLQIPEHETIEFWVASDDGGTVKIGVHEFGNWQDQGCSATETGLIDIEVGTAILDAWFYENGGGTCFMFAWNIDNTGWSIVQPEFFTSEPLPSATTSTLETTTTEQSTTSTSTTSSVPQTTTTESTTTTTQPPETTTSIYLPTTTESPETTTSSPETIAPSSPLPSSPQPQPFPPAITEPPPLPIQILPPIPEPTTSVQTTEPPTTTTTVETTTTTVEIPATTLPEASTSLLQPPESTTSTITTPTTIFEPDATPDQPLTEAAFVEALAVLVNATPDEVQMVVDQILEADLSSEQAEQLVASTEVLTTITGEQAQQLFDQIEPTQLSESMASVIAGTLNNPDVSTEVKEAFEESINIFGNDGFAIYVPLGSNVNVAVRRTIIAGTTILVALPSPVARRT